MTVKFTCDPDELFTVAQVAEKTGYKIRYIRQEIKSGRLAGVSIIRQCTRKNGGGWAGLPTWRVTQGALDYWLAKRADREARLKAMGKLYHRKDIDKAAKERKEQAAGEQAEEREGQVGDPLEF